MNKSIFKHNLTPQRRHLIANVCSAVRKRTLRTECLQLALIHMREIGVAPFLKEWGHSIAHVRRDKGWLWNNAIQIWATHLYYELIDRKNIRLSPLPVDVFMTIKEFVENRPKRQLENEMMRVYGNAVPRDEVLATLAHLYAQGGKGPFKAESSVFMFLRSKVNEPNDEHLIRWLITICEEDALSIPPLSMCEIVADFERGLKALGLITKFSDEDRQYLELHFLVSFHNTLIDVSERNFFEIAGMNLPEKRQPMLCVNSYGDVLGLYIGFFSLENGRWLEPDNIRTGDRFERYYYPLISTSLHEDEFLIEPDENIRACLYNHPLRVRMVHGKPALVALERQNSPFPPVRFKLQRKKRRGTLI